MTSLRQSQLTWLWCAAGCPAPATTAMSALVPGATPPSSTGTPGPQEDQDLDQSEVIIQCHVTSYPPITAHLGTSTVAEHISENRESIIEILVLRASIIQISNLTRANHQ